MYACQFYCYLISEHIETKQINNIRRIAGHYHDQNVAALDPPTSTLGKPIRSTNAFTYLDSVAHAFKALNTNVMANATE